MYGKDDLLTPPRHGYSASLKSNMPGYVAFRKRRHRHQFWATVSRR